MLGEVGPIGQDQGHGGYEQEGVAPRARSALRGRGLDAPGRCGRALISVDLPAGVVLFGPLIGFGLILE